MIGFLIILLVIGIAIMIIVLGNKAMSKHKNAMKRCDSCGKPTLNYKGIVSTFGDDDFTGDTDFRVIKDPSGTKHIDLPVDVQCPYCGTINHKTLYIALDGRKSLEQAVKEQYV